MGEIVPHLAHFGYKKTFIQKYGAFDSIYFVNARHQLRLQKNLLTKMLFLPPKMAHLAHFNHNKIFSKLSKVVTFTHLLKSVIRYDLRKNLMKRYRKKSKYLGFGSRNALFTPI